MQNYKSPGTLWARFGQGLLQSYVATTEQERRQRYDQQLLAQRGEQARGLEQQNADNQIRYLREQGNITEANRGTANEDAAARQHREFMQNLVSAAATQGVLTPELASRFKEEAGNDIGPEAISILDAISAGSASDKKAKMELERSKIDARESTVPKTVDLSQLKGDLTAGIGYEPAPEVIQGVAALVQAGIAPIAAVRQLYPGATEIPKATQPSGEKLKDVAGIMRNLETAHAEQVKAATALGISQVDVAERVAAGEEPVDAFRHAESDKYIEQIVQTLGIQPNQPIDMKAVNSVLSSNGFHPITGADQRTLTDLVDEMVRHNIGGGGKKPKVETIMAIIQAALAPPQQPRAQANVPGLGALTRGAMKVGAALTPGVTYDQMTRKPVAGGGPAFQNRAVQGQRNP